MDEEERFMRVRCVGGPSDGKWVTVRIMRPGSHRPYGFAQLWRCNESKIVNGYQIVRFFGENESVYYLKPKGWPVEKCLLHLLGPQAIGRKQENRAIDGP